MTQNSDPFAKIGSSREVVVNAIKSNLLSDDDLISFLKIDGDLLQHVDDHSKANLNIVAAAYAQNPSSIQHAGTMYSEEGIRSWAESIYSQVISERETPLEGNNTQDDEVKKSSVVQKIIASVETLFQAVGQVVINSFSSIISYSANTAKQFFSSSRNDTGGDNSSQGNVVDDVVSINYNATNNSVHSGSLVSNMGEGDINKISSGSTSEISEADNKGDGAPGLR